MIVINKQKFLAELGKLLTFINNEEDRQTAIAMYSEMFDAAANETDLLQALSSPTKQAVLVARSYDSRAARDPGDTNPPAFVAEIARIRSEIFASLENKTVDTAVPEAPQEPAFDLEADLAAMSMALAEADDEPYPAEEEQPEQSAEAPAAQEPEAVPAESGELYSEPYIPDPGPVEDEEPAPPAESSDEALDAFMAEYTAPIEAAPEEPSDAPEEDEPEAEPELNPLEPEQGLVELLEAADEGKAGTVRKPRVFLLILYLLAAIPIGVIGTAVLIVPTVLFLVLAAAVIFCGVALVFAALSGFAVVADLFVVLGAAIITLSLGLLLLWVFLWFVIGAIAGLIRGLCSLGSKWCYKEVEING